MTAGTAVGWAAAGLGTGWVFQHLLARSLVWGMRWGSGAPFVILGVSVLRWFVVAAAAAAVAAVSGLAGAAVFASAVVVSHISGALRAAFRFAPGR